LEKISVGEYLIKQIYDQGVRHIFGVPGDYILGFCDMLVRSDQMILVNTCDEQGAGFAADAYARLSGLGVVCITYGVGGLKVTNTTAQAYAEKSPVIVISGAPGMKERENDPLLHHKVRGFDTQKKVFEQITVFSTVLENPEKASDEINKAIEYAKRFKRPVYIELPRDIVYMPVSRSNNRALRSQEETDSMILSEAVSEAIEMINKAEKPVILAGVEIHRFGLKEKLIQFINKTAIPVATTILSKSVIDGLHPLYLGVYAGAIGQDSVREYVESSDCLIVLGALMDDINLGGFTAKLDRKHTIDVSSEGMSIRYHHYDTVRMESFISSLGRSGIRPRKHGRNAIPHSVPAMISAPTANRMISTKYIIERLNSLLTSKMLVLADVGDALFAGTDLLIVGNTEFISPAYYASLGFAVPASLGAKLARPDMRAVVIVGDGAFQMTGMELSTALRYHINPIVLVLNNSGYLTERLMLDGPFNDIQKWDYSQIPKVLGGGKGYLVKTEDQFDKAMHAAIHYIEEFSILDIHLEPFDKSTVLEHLAKRFAGKIKKG